MPDDSDTSPPSPPPLVPVPPKPGTRPPNLVPVPPAPSLATRPPLAQIPAATVKSTAPAEDVIMTPGVVAPAIASALRHRAVVGPTEWVDETFRVWGVTKFALFVSLALAIAGGVDIGDMQKMPEMELWGLIASLIAGLLLLSILPAWMTWRFSKFRETPTNFVFAFMLCLVSLAIAGAVYVMPGFQAVGALKERQAAALAAVETAGTALKNGDDSPQAFGAYCYALERLAASGGQDGPAAGVLAKFLREFIDNRVAMEAAGEKLAALPGYPANPEDYAQYITAYDDYAKAVRKQNAFVKSMDATFNSLADAAGGPAVLDHPLIASFRKGFSAQSPTLIAFTASFDKGLAAMAQGYRIMQANHGKWKADDDKFAVFDEPAAQSQFDTQYQLHLAELEKAGALEEQLASPSVPSSPAGVPAPPEATAAN